MTPELCQKLKEKYPRVYGVVRYGWGVQDGWFDLLDKLGADIMASDDLSEDYETLQIKEKFGLLRFYYDNKGKAIPAVNEAMQESACICESCGSRENVETESATNTGWIKTYCENCRGGPGQG